MSDISTLLEEAKELELKYTDLEKADDLLTKAIISAEKKKSPLLAECYNTRGVVRRGLASRKDSDITYDNSFHDYVSALKTAVDNNQRSLANINKADIYRVSRNDLKKAHESIDEALALAEYRSFEHAKALAQRGLVYRAQDDPDSASQSQENTLNIIKELLKTEPENRYAKKLLGMTLQNLGVDYSNLKNPTDSKIDNAYAFALQGLDVAQAIGDQRGIENSIATMGKISMLKDNSQNALYAFQKAFDIAKKSNDDRSISGIAIHLAEIHLRLGENTGAQQYLEIFAEGILTNAITCHDSHIDKELIRRVETLYDKSGLDIKIFNIASLQYLK